MSVSRSLCVTTLAIAAAAGGVSSAQAPVQQPPVFRAEANLVEVIVRVTDEQDRFVPDLTRQDFELRDEGRAQTIVAFDYVNLPREATRTADEARLPADAPDMSTVATNETAGTGRLFVLLLDDMLTSSVYALPVRHIAREFIEQHVGPGDLMAVFSTAGHGVVNQEFTNDKARVLEVVDRFLGGPCADADDEEVYRLRVATDVMSAVARHLGGIRGRRVSLLWISEGVAYNLANPRIQESMNAGVFGRANIADTGTVAHAMRSAIDALRESNVTLYAVDPRRLWAPGLLLKPCQGSRRSVDVLRQFSEQTGGFAAVDTNDFRVPFERILEENSQYYVLGFQPSRLGRPGEFRDIQVGVPGRPGLRVSARPGYRVSRPEAPTPRPTGMAPVLADALVSSLPTAGLPLRVQAIPRRGPDGMGQVHVVVEVAGKDLSFAEVEGRHQEHLEFALRTIDLLARSDHNQKTTLTLNLSPLQLEDLRRTHVRWLSTLAVKPGHHSLRVAGHGQETGQTGSVFLDVDVPKFDDDRLWIGGLAVSSPAALALDAGSLPDHAGLPGSPTTLRTFPLGAAINVAVEVMAPPSFTSGAIDMTILRQRGAAEDAPLLRQTTPLANRDEAARVHTWTIDTATVGSGAFVLRLSLREGAGDRVDTTMLFDVTGGTR